MKGVKISSPVGGEYTSRLVRYPLITSELDNLLGRVLTIIDATISEPVQNKAVKDIIRGEFSHKMHTVFWDYCYRREFKWNHDSFLVENIVDSTLKAEEGR